MLIGDTTAVAISPSTPWTVAVADGAAPLRLTRVTGPGHGPVSGADPVTHVNVIVTGERYQPYFVFGCLLVTTAVIAGFVVAFDAEDPVNDAVPAIRGRHGPDPRGGVGKRGRPRR